MTGDDLRRMTEELRAAAERVAERVINAPRFSWDAMGDVAERVETERAVEREAERQAAFERMSPIWDASAAKIELRSRIDEAVERLNDLPLSEAECEAWGDYITRIEQAIAYGDPRVLARLNDLDAEVQSVLDESQRNQ